MKKFCIFLCLLALQLTAQTIAECRERFNRYLNFRGSLTQQVRFDEKSITLLSHAKPELVLYEEELPALSAFLQSASLKAQESLLRQKGTRKLKPSTLDSLLKLSSQPPLAYKAADPLPLKGYRIALDPGHSAITLAEAQLEQKFLYFAKPDNSSDSVRLFESFLTFNTASILKKMLEEKGATVMLTRQAADQTSFGCTLSEWMRKDKKRCLDSLHRSGSLSTGKYQQLLKATDYNVFWDFFRDFDLAHRASLVNEFAPHVTLIIHYNVDEKNVPWNKYTSKNFTMAFIGGAFTADNLSRTEGRVNFVRLLVSPQLNLSERLASETVGQFKKHLAIAVARSTDADYLKNNCLSTSSPGVFCRNLALCRKINSPLVYGESLYQDNIRESALLMGTELDLNGLTTNARLQQVATSYYEGLLAFLKSRP